MSRSVVALAVGLVLAVGGRASAEGLGIGDPAPKLEVKEFVKGDPVKEIEKGKIYVVEFWATWCGPCIQSIPHVTELQKKNKDVVFIGVSVWERQPEKVKPFVEEMGEKMAYRVAMDDAAADNPSDGKMAKNWMSAAGRSGIPCAFIVNGEGKVAWIGHPMSMDKPLAEIVSGKWDIAKAAADYKAEQAAQAKMRALSAKLRAAQESNDPKAVLGVIDEVIKDDPALERQLATTRFTALCKVGDADKTLEYANRLVDETYKDNAQGLNHVSWTLVEKPGDKPDTRLMKVALRAAERADKLVEGKDGAIADTLAKAYYETGDAAKALEHQERAVQLAKGTPLAQDEGMKDRLELYKKAAKK